MLHKQQQSAALRSWELTKDRTARTTNGRIAAEARFERLVDPDGVMTPDERQKAAQEARKAHFRAIGAKGGKARAKNLAKREAKTK